MSDQQHERPSPEASGAPRGRTSHNTGTGSPRDGGIPAQLRNTLKGGPNGEARESIERATAVVGDDESDAS